MSIARRRATLLARLLALLLSVASLVIVATPFAPWYDDTVRKWDEHVSGDPYYYALFVAFTAAIVGASMACAAAEHIEALGEDALLHGPEPHRMASVKAPHRTANAGLALWSVGRSWLLACLQKEQHRLLLLCRAVLWCCLAVACIAPSGSAVGPWGGHFALVTAAATGALTLGQCEEDDGRNMLRTLLTQVYHTLVYYTLYHL